MTALRDREAWLTELARKAAPHLRAACAEFDEEPVVRLACGFPAAQGRRKVAAAQILPPSCSDDDTAELLVSPTVDDAHTVARLVLPLLLAAYAGEWQQGAGWRDAVRRAGFRDDSAVLPEWAAVVVESLGAYPHAAVTLPPRKVQGTRLLLATCDGSADAGWLHDTYRVRLTAKAAAFGLPVCPCGETMTLQATEGN